MFTYQSVAHFVSVDQMHCILFMCLYSSHHFILYFGSSLHPWLNTRIMGTLEQHFPSSPCSGLCVSHVLFPTSQWFVWPLFSLCGRSHVTCDFPINFLGIGDRNEMKSCLGHHYLFISSAHNYRSSSCSICKLDANRSMLPLFFPFWFFSFP